MNGAYYNEHDPFAAEWLRGLIREGLIAPGDVDQRDIQLVQPADLRGYAQVHAFAGIGGWSYALRLAGWDDARPVWTGSCPCQPYSSAGKGEGADDARNLWPHWFRLIRECRPPVVFGEQVEAAIRHGWLDAVSTDLEAEGYAFGACVLGAHSVGAPHIRQRVWFVADAAEPEGGWRGLLRPREGVGASAERRAPGESVRSGAADLVGDPDNARPQGRRERRDGSGERVVGAAGVADGLDHPAGARHDSARQGPEGEARDEARVRGPERGRGRHPWADLVWLPCRDGKARPAQPGIFPLVDGVSGRVAVGRAVQPPAASFSPEQAAHEFSRVGVLRGAGNAINPYTAAEVIGAFMDCKD